MQTYIHAYMHTYRHTSYTHGRLVNESPGPDSPVSMHTHTYMQTYMHLDTQYMQTHNTCICRHTYMQTYIRADIHTCRHTYMQRYIHTYSQSPGPGPLVNASFG